ncbi:hypothetical protein SAMN05216371_0394 [Streptomyces sp. TLI_053]|uniref:DUF6461 domain-containing protein n=1 Tax=Streptomyces sp. TLI_053 TaxID=1855352 RepID=UPI00087D076F|nr:DUF6461 domain-containing protein [Streptomyces sp. TLI_053]SDS67702.1 hypothetical protein SAMN05216371_0394 [Streptomyces sp. TLI_053]
MTVTAADYSWFEDTFPDLAEAYCLTLVKDLAPADLLRRLDGEEGPVLTGAAAVVEAAYRLGDSQQLVAMARVGPWTLMIEPNGHLGVDEERALPASAGTTWISHFCNVNGLGSFLWAEDGGVRSAFEPVLPDSRWGSTPDDQLSAMHRVGFHFGTDAPDVDRSVAAAFALAETMTGVRPTPELLGTTAFTCGFLRIR